jgi:hypothetical protein
MLKKIAKYITSNDNLDPIIKEVAEATNRNDVYGAWMIIAKKILHNDKLTKAFEGLDLIHNFHGDLTSGLKQARKELTDMATKAATQHLGKDEWARIYKNL